MNSLMKSDIFFFITSVAVVLITLLLAIGLIYVITILRTIKMVSKQVKREAEMIGQDIEDIRSYARTQSWTVKTFSGMIGAMMKRRFNSNSKK